MFKHQFMFSGHDQSSTTPRRATPSQSGCVRRCFCVCLRGCPFCVGEEGMVLLQSRKAAVSSRIHVAGSRRLDHYHLHEFGNWLAPLGFISFCCFQMNKRFLLCFSFSKDVSNQNIKKRLQGRNRRLFVEKRAYSLKSQYPKGMKRVFAEKRFSKK